MTENDLIELFKRDTMIANILTIIEKIGGPQLYLSAGTLRNFVWDQLSKKTTRQLTDIDIIFFDETVSYEETCQLEGQLKKDYPAYDWEVKNQVYMHQHNPGTAPYSNLTESLASFPETCTAIALRKVGTQYELVAPHGIDDLVNFDVKPTPHFLETAERLVVYQNRVTSKHWQSIWPQLTLFNMN